MSLPIPFCDRARLRLFDKVETVDDTYRIRDVGLEYQDGTIDSIAVGGNFTTLSGWCGLKDDEEFVPEDASTTA